MSTADTSLSGLPTSADHARWQELLDQLDADELVARFTEMLTEIPDYDPPPMPLSEVLRTARVTFLTLIAQLRTGEHATDGTAAAELGAARARAGLPMASLVSAIRLDFTVIWEALTRISHIDDAELIIRHTARILSTVDDYALQTQRAYVAELQRVQSEKTSVIQGHIAGLFQGSQPTGERLQAIASGLGVPVEANFTVVAAIGDDIPALRSFVTDAGRAGLTVFTRHVEDALVAFFRLEQLAEARRPAIDERLRSLRVGMLTTRSGLRDVRNAANTASELAHFIRDDEVRTITWRSGWPRVAKNQLLAANHPVLADVQAALATCGQAERSRLVEAVTSYLRTGSIGDSAAELFCHRNTLSNRLRRFADLTGVDPLIPEQSARLVVGWA